MSAIWEFSMNGRVTNVVALMLYDVFVGDMINVMSISPSLSSISTSPIGVTYVIEVVSLFCDVIEVVSLCCDVFVFVLESTDIIVDFRTDVTVRNKNNLFERVFWTYLYL